MKPGKIIFINGTSSSGKTSIVHAFQNSIPEMYIECGIDKFIWMMPGRYLERPLWDDVLGLANKAGKTGHQLVRGMHKAIQTLSQAGINVVADHVFVERQWAKECAMIFASLPAYLIGINCPLQKVEERERNRKNRTLGQAGLQMSLIHKYTKYDLEVDTSLHSPQECADQIVARLTKPPEGFQMMLGML